MGRPSNSLETLLEYDECLLLVQYLTLKKIKFSHIHNEMYTKSWSQKNKAKAMGVSSGVPDYMMIINGKMVFIEMKRTKNSKISPTQKEWLEELGKLNNVYTFVCYGFDQAVKVIESL